MATGTTSRGRPRSFDRDAALDQTIRLFWRNGYEATSMRELSSSLGISAPSLYAAFGGKLSVFQEAVTVYDQKYGGFIDDAITEEPTATAAMHRILAEAPNRYTRRGLPRGCLVAAGDAGTADEKVRSWLTGMRNGKTQELVAKIETDLVAGQLPAHTDAHALAAYVMVVLSGLVQRARDGASRAELEAIARTAAAALPVDSSA